MGYASADLFVFPSVIDEAGNAALEALRLGLPSLVAGGSGIAPGWPIARAHGAARRAARTCGRRRSSSCRGAHRRAAMARAARAYVEAHVPSLGRGADRGFAAGVAGRGGRADMTGSRMMDARRILVLAPHPDDEIVVAASPP